MTGRFQVYEDRAQRHRFRLKDGQGKVVAVGEGYETREGALQGCEAVKEAAAGAEIVDLTESAVTDADRHRIEREARIAELRESADQVERMRFTSEDPVLVEVARATVLGVAQQLRAKAESYAAMPAGPVGVPPDQLSESERRQSEHEDWMEQIARPAEPGQCGAILNRPGRNVVCVLPPHNDTDHESRPDPDGNTIRWAYWYDARKGRGGQ